MLFISNYLCLNSLWKKVGFCGYISFYTHDIPGDVIGVFPNVFFTDMMKICFVFSIVITFPVMVFPCRASIYTLLFAKVRHSGLSASQYLFSFSYLKPHAHAPNLKIEFKDCHVNAVEIMLHVKHL